MKAGIKKISEITGYSTATVSNALNRKRGVNSNTAEEIFRVARKIGYIDAKTITKIKLLIYKKNGLIIDDTPFFPLLINGFERECRESGYEMAISNLDVRQPGYSEQAIRMINEPDTANVLLGTELTEEELVLYKQAKSPLLLLDYWSMDMEFNSVMIDNDDSVRKAIHYLYKKGHKKIGYLKGKLRIQGFRQREYGYYAAMRENALEIYPEYIIELNTTMNGAYQDMLSCLEKSRPLPTAFFADNDVIALGAMKALQEKGYQIPGDISLIGFDDLPFCEISSPRLTSLRVPKQEMGKLAAKKIISMLLAEEDVRSKIQVCTEFIERDSVIRLE